MTASLAAFPPVMAMGQEEAPTLDFMVIGDWGARGSRRQLAVARAMAAEARRRPPRFIISTGDNFYRRGVRDQSDPAWRKSWDAIYNDEALRRPWYIVLGNHDYKGNVAAEIGYSDLDPRWRLPARYYRVVEDLPRYGKAEFFFLDTTPIANSGNAADTELAAEQIAWLAEGLAGSSARWRFAIGHHPVLSSGRHGGDAPMQRLVQPLLERFRVAAYFSGHDHDLEHIEQGGVHYFISGAGAFKRAVRRTAGSRFAASTLGFVAARLGLEALDVAFIDRRGATLHRTAIPPPT